MSLVFNNYSKYYNLLYQDKNYQKEASYIANLLGTAKSILELGCGTGKHASILNSLGFECYGVDQSLTMLEEAKRLGVNCELADIRTFRINKKFDAVISLFHVVSYLTNEGDILAYFDTVKEHLKPEGILIFDVWHKDAVVSQIPEKRIKNLENDEIIVTRKCTPEHIPAESTVKVNYSIEIKDKITNNIEVINETHPMRYFSFEEINNLAESKGFKIIKSEEWLTSNPPGSDTWGVCYILRLK